tara:strand:- start:1073 stop:1246 length:174 start_codon:yes stop_codon:yes gene_type:complete
MKPCFMEVIMTFATALVYLYLVTMIGSMIYVAWKVKKWCDREEIDEIRIKRDWPQAE